MDGSLREKFGFWFSALQDLRKQRHQRAAAVILALYGYGMWNVEVLR